MICLQAELPFARNSAERRDTEGSKGMLGHVVCHPSKNGSVFPQFLSFSVSSVHGFISLSGYLGSEFSQIEKLIVQNCDPAMKMLVSLSG